MANLGLALSVAVAALLLTAALGKTANPDSSTALIATVTGLPWSAALRVAHVVAFAEIVGAALLVVPGAFMVGALYSAALGILFSLVVMLAVLRRAALSCGCFGAGSEKPLRARDASNGVVIAAAVLFAYAEPPAATFASRLALLAVGASLVTFFLHRSEITATVRVIRGVA